MIARVLACIALAVACLSGRHVTVWFAGCPLCSVPALAVVALFAAAAVAVLAAFAWWMRAAFAGPLVRRTT